MGRITACFRICAAAYCAAFILFCQPARASSDVGYIINGDTFSFIIRYGMGEQSETGDFTKPHATLTELTRWLWKNREFLHGVNGELTYWPGGYSLRRVKFPKNGEMAGEEKTVDYRPGNAAKVIILDLKKLYALPDGRDIDARAPKLIVQYYDIHEGIATENVEKIDGISLFSGAIPGGCMEPPRKVKGRNYDCVDLSIGMVSGDVAKRKNIEIMPLTARNLKRVMRIAR